VNLTPEQVIGYVKATAEILALPLNDARIQSVADHLIRTAAMARQLDALHLEADAEPAQVYCPAPFPGHPTQSAE
jgi:Protein of unknown function (DUF4089)